VPGRQESASKGRNGARLSLEPRAHVGIARKFHRENLDRDGPIEAGIARFVDSPMPPRPSVRIS